MYTSYYLYLSREYSTEEAEYPFKSLHSQKKKSEPEASKTKVIVKIKFESKYRQHKVKLAELINAYRELDGRF